MFSGIDDNRDTIDRLCRSYHVRRLELFGSAARGQFDPITSDLDFLVDFEPLRSGEHADNYFGLLEELESLFGRPIDLVMERAIKNQYFLEGIARSRTVLYAA
jgi:predicted nucleotidyltransferase